MYRQCLARIVRNATWILLGAWFVAIAATPVWPANETAKRVVFTVVHVGDSGPGSLRQAIEDANAVSSDQVSARIVFAIPGNGPHVIEPVTELPAIVGSVVLDGFSQLGIAPADSRQARDGRTAGALEGGLLDSPSDGPTITEKGPDAVEPTAELPEIVGSVAVDGEGQLGVVSADSGQPRKGKFDVVLDGRLAGSLANGLLIRGGSSTVRGLWIRGFSNDAIRIEGADASGSDTGGVYIEGNRIGGRETGNGGGIAIVNSPRNIIGGLSPEAANQIIGNKRYGVFVQGLSARSNAILGNSIAFNGGLGIELRDEQHPDTASGADPLDVDDGPNGLQNAPVLRAVSNVAGDGRRSLKIEGRLESAPREAFRLEFFATRRSEAAAVLSNGPTGGAKSASHHVDAQRLIAWSTVTTGEDGGADFFLTIAGSLPAGELVTAIATDREGNSSEISDAVSAAASPISWNNPNGGNWSVPTNWSPNQVPGASDMAQITLPGTYTVTLDVEAQVGSLMLGGTSDTQTLLNGSHTLTLAGASAISSNGALQLGGTLTGTGDLVADGSITWTAGVMSGTGQTTVNGSLAMSGAAIKSLLRKLVVNGSAIWTGGRFDMYDGGSVEIGSTGTFDTQFDGTILERSGTPPFTNKGLFKKSAGGGNLTISNLIAFINMNPGMVEVQAGTLLIQSSGSVHSGSFKSTGGVLAFDANTHTLDPASSVTGTEVDFTGANVTLQGAYNVSTTKINSGTISFNNSPTMTTLELSGGDLSGSGNVAGAASIVWTGGSMSGTGQTTVNGMLTMSGAAIKSLLRKLIINGSVMWTGGRFDMYDGGGVMIGPTGTLDVKFDGTILERSGTPPFTNMGLFKKSAGGGALTIGNFIGFINTNPGMVDVQAGTLLIQSSGSVHSGSFKSTGGVLAFDANTHTLDPASSVSGTEVDFTGANVTLQGAYNVSTTKITSGTISFNNSPTMTTLQLTGGDLSGSGNIAGAASILWTGGSMSGTGQTTVNGTLTMSSAAILSLLRKLVVNGSAIWTGGRFDMYDGGSVEIGSAGTFDAQFDGTILERSGTPPFTNKGLFKKSAGGGNLTISNLIAFINMNPGIVDVQAGTLLIQSSGSVHSGSFKSTGGVLAFDANTHTLDPASSVSGTEVDFTGANVTLQGAYNVSTTKITSGTISFNNSPTMTTLQLTGGELSGSGNIAGAASILWTGGSMSGTGQTTVNGTLTMSGAAIKSLLRKLVVNGSAIWTGGRFDLYDGGSVEIGSTGAFDAQFDGTILERSGTPPFTNKGLFKKSAGGGNLTIGNLIAFINMNPGVVDVQAGTLLIQSSGSVHSGSFKSTGGVLAFDANTHTLDPASSVSGTEVDFTGANVTLQGAYNVSTTKITSGTISFNNSPTMTSLQLTGGELSGSGNIAGAASILWTGGSMSGTGQTTVNGTLTISGTAIKSLLRKLVVNGSAIWTGGRFDMYDGGSVEIGSTGTFDTQFDGTILERSGAPPFTNKGLFKKSAGGGNLTISNLIAFINMNPGVVEVQAGTLLIQSSGSVHSGSFKSTGGVLAFGANTHTLDPASSVTGTEVDFTGANVTLQGAYNVSTTKITSGTISFNNSPTMTTLELSGGDLSGSGNVAGAASIIWTGGSMSGTGQTTVNGMLTMSGTAIKSLLRKLVVNGSAIWNGGRFDMYDGGSVEIASTGIFDTQFEGTILERTGSPPFTNKGLFKKSAGGGSLTIGVHFSNMGTVRIVAGTLACSYIQTAGATILDGGSLSGNLTLQGGSLQGNGTITGSVNNSGGSVNPGLSAGCLRIAGTYAQGGGGTYAVELGQLTACSQFDQLNVTGSASLGGALTVTLIGGFAPAIGNTFVIMTFGSREGQFPETLPSPGPGMAWVVHHNPTSVVLEVVPGGPGCPADCNSDGTVNVLDLQLMVNCILGAGSCSCRDLNTDGTLNVLDLQLMVNCILRSPGNVCETACTGAAVVVDQQSQERLLPRIRNGVGFMGSP